MDCRKAQDMLHAWIDMELTEEERVELTAHLAECSQCAKKLAQYKHLDALLNQLDAQVKVPAGLYGRIMEAVNREAEPTQGIHRWTRWAASAAAVLLLGVAVGVLWRAGIWPAPMKNHMKYGAAQEAAPEAPEAERWRAAGEAPAQEDTTRMGRGEGSPEEEAGEPFSMACLGPMEVTWAPEGGEAPLDMLNAFCEEYGLTVAGSGDDWISVQWEDEGQREALLAFLAENGELTGQENLQDGNLLRINLR